MSSNFPRSHSLQETRGGSEKWQIDLLPPGVRASSNHDLAPAYMKVDSVDRTEPAEGLDQAGGVNGCCSCHGQNGKRLRLHRGYTAVSRTTDREGAVTRGG